VSFSLSGYRVRRTAALLFGSLVGITMEHVVARAQGDSTPLDRLSIHGYLAFAYGISGGHPHFGIPTDGTAITSLNLVS
jgi:hypothetical protein